VGIWRTGTEPMGSEGAGESRRAIELAGELRREPRDEVGVVERVAMRAINRSKQHR